MSFFALGFKYSHGNSLGYKMADSGPVLLGYLSCTGNEKRLLECNQNHLAANTNYQCTTHNYDVVLKCTRKL